MEKLRDLYGTDCVVVHSFRVDDRYRVVVALGNRDSVAGVAANSTVKDVVSNRQIHWDTLIDDDMAGLDDLPNDQPDGIETGRHGTSPQALPDISSGLLGLRPASRHWKPLSHQLFSNRNRMISEPRFFQTCWQPLLPRAQMHSHPYSGNSESETMWNPLETAATVARVTSFPTPVELLVNSSADAPLQADSTEARPEEASIREFAPRIVPKTLPTCSSIVLPIHGKPSPFLSLSA